MATQFYDLARRHRSRWSELDALLAAAERDLVPPGTALEAMADRALEAEIDPRRVVRWAAHEDAEGMRVVGFVDAERDWPELGTLVIRQIVVAPAHRHRGLGRALVLDVLRRAQSQGQVRELAAFVLRRTGTASSFWEGLGLRPDDQGRRWRGDVEHLNRLSAD